MRIICKKGFSPDVRSWISPNLRYFVGVLAFVWVWGMINSRHYIIVLLASLDVRICVCCLADQLCVDFLVVTAGLSAFVDVVAGDVVFGIGSPDQHHALLRGH